MTEAQEKIYDAIKGFIKEFGYAPTIREIGEIVNLKSPSPVFKHLLALEEKGYITQIKGKSRTIRIVK